MKCFKINYAMVIMKHCYNNNNYNSNNSNNNNNNNNQSQGYLAAN